MFIPCYYIMKVYNFLKYYRCLKSWKKDCLELWTLLECSSALKIWSQTLNALYVYYHLNRKLLWDRDGMLWIGHEMSPQGTKVLSGHSPLVMLLRHNRLWGHQPYQCAIRRKGKWVTEESLKDPPWLSPDLFSSSFFLATMVICSLPPHPSTRFLL